MLTAPLAYAQEKSCGVKSAVLYKESHQQGSVNRLTIYVDDFGRSPASEVSIRIGKNKSLYFRHIVYDTYVLSVRDDEQTAEKLPVEAEPVNYLRLTPRITKKRPLRLRMAHNRIARTNKPVQDFVCIVTNRTAIGKKY